MKFIKDWIGESSWKYALIALSLFAVWIAISIIGCYINIFLGIVISLVSGIFLMSGMGHEGGV